MSGGNFHWPLHIDRDATLTLDVDADELAARLSRWCSATGFRCLSAYPGRRTYRRGSWWEGLFAFDITMVPIHVEIILTGEQPITVRVLMSCQSYWHLSTPGDGARIEGELETLLNYLEDARM